LEVQEKEMSYLIACMLSAFTVGVIFGVMIESKSRSYFMKNKKGDK
jgi:hypothetical protein